MMTTFEANEADCPYRVSNISDENDDSGTSPYHQFWYNNCLGCKCPKWRPAYLFLKDHPVCHRTRVQGATGIKVMDDVGDSVALEECHRSKRVRDCSLCPYAYGFCGG